MLTSAEIPKTLWAVVQGLHGEIQVLIRTQKVVGKVAAARARNTDT